MIGAMVSHLFLLLFLQATPAPTAPPLVTTLPERLVNGGAFLVRVTPPEPWQAVEGTLAGKKLFFEREASGAWAAFAGLDVDAAPGRHELALHAKTEAGRAVSLTAPLTVEHAERPKSELSVAKKFLEPDKKTLARIERERKIKAERLGALTPERLFTGPFGPPVESPTSEGYGVERVFNGKRQSVHLGLDYRAPMGTPVHAVADGRVALARAFFYEGRCVALDHGHGLYTLYLHFSRLDVKEGARVKKGQLLGLSGASGRVTGPHLHLAARWQGIYLDPATVLALPVP
jgi:murein DD-endopeptidase MepM/ murein hydrolase activator NlpD